VKVEITRHAAERLDRRRIALAWVEETLRCPEWTEADPGDPALMRAFRRIAAMENRVLRVVFSRPGADVYRVITAFFDRDALWDPQHG
jgi:hypothetical protein